MIPYDRAIKRFATAKANKANWDSHLRECYKYALPERNTIDIYAKGAKKRELIYDSTAVDALEDYATRMTSLLIPSHSKWIVMEAGNQTPEDKEIEINKYLENANEILYDNINSSNFTSQMHEAFLDLGISTGAVIVEEGDGIQSSLNYRAISLSEIYPEKSSKGIIETVWREFKIPVKDIKYTWKRAKLTAGLEKILEEKPETEILLIEGVVEEAGKLYTVLIYEQEKDFLYNEQIESSNWVVFRESTIAGETLGRGRVMRVLSDIKTLNKMKEDYLRSLAWQANPLFTAVDDGLINPYTVKLEPGAVIPVGNSETLRAVQVGGNPQLLDFAIKGLQESIRKTLLSQPFGSIQETPVRSATEMSIRNADAAQISVGASNRIQTECLEAIIKQSVYILKKAGKIADFKIDGQEVKLKFVNPSSMQQQERKLAGYGRFIEIAQALPPEQVMRAIKTEEIPEEIWETLGLPAKYIRNEEERGMIDQQMAQQQQQQQAMAEAQSGVNQQQ